MNILNKDEQEVIIKETYEDYVITNYGIYPIINNNIIKIYDWINTIKYKDIYIIIGNDDVIIYENGNTVKEHYR